MTIPSSQPNLEHTPERPAPRSSRVWIRTVKYLGLVLAFLALGSTAFLTQEHWKPILFPPMPANEEETSHALASPAAPTEKIYLSDQAQKNLNLTAQPIKIETYWKTISVPGMVIDRPGLSDRGVVTPVTGVVSRIHKFAGDTVRPGDVLFTLTLLSESLQLSQADLFKSTQDIKLASEQRKRLTSAGGGIAESKVIEADNQLFRLNVAVKAYRQELLIRGLSPAQIDGVADGTFVSEIPIVVPRRPISVPVTTASPSPETSYEVQDVKVELGQQVQAGQTLSMLSNHHLLSVEGRAFRDETPLLERAVKEDWPVVVDFREGDAGDWPTPPQSLPIRYLANTIDPDTRTFRFLLPLDNQSRVVERDGHSQFLWRYRPGQRVRLLVRVEQLTNVYTLPAAAVAREGANAYVFRQNGNTFDRKPVQVVWQDSDRVVIANDGSVPPGLYVAQAGAAQLNRMMKSQSDTTPAGFHIHADGSVHMGKH